eukprot:CAMPEP_0172469574 /NCGR_PEP_ID=MMETSP1065-20121228/64105_1 /TAXON_ID=265537 /ORGANISM="Amphiprora paludosa, Strain CCMP125" /LENGTH=55 /DNA_ID=CAMNT_0013227287 /DNA_START=102 /DNA_END=265 /DNA_ORIENTATION=+
MTRLLFSQGDLRIRFRSGMFLITNRHFSKQAVEFINVVLGEYYSMGLGGGGGLGV